MKILVLLKMVPPLRVLMRAEMVKSFCVISKASALVTWTLVAPSKESR